MSAPTLVSAPRPRKLQSWIASYISATAERNAPKPFLLWSAIGCVAGALERKVWVRLGKLTLYPNMYTILVGPPGVGKGLALDYAEQLWRGLEDHHVSPTSVNFATVIDALDAAPRRINIIGGNPPFVEFNSLKILSNELGVLLPVYDPIFMAKLTDIYDGKLYSEERRTGSIKRKIEKPQLNLLAGDTPNHIGKFPDNAWDGGFFSRTILVYSEEIARQSLFPEIVDESATYNALAQDLEAVACLYGEIHFTGIARELYNNWYLAGGPPIPKHPKLRHYLSRRHTHLAKLMMVASVSRGSDMLITEEDFHQGLNWLLSAENDMPDIFHAMAGGQGEKSAMDDTYHHVYILHAKEGKPVAEHRIIHFLSSRVPSHSVQRVLEIMVRARMLEKELTTTGIMVYKPGIKS